MHKFITISTYENNLLLFKNTTTAIIEDNFLTYHTDNDTINFNLNIFSFTKDNNESTLKLTKNNCYLKLKEINEIINIPIDYLNFSYNNKEILLEYKLASMENNLKIIIEIGSVLNEL